MSYNEYGTSASPNPVRELVEKMTELMPETLYALVGPDTFIRLLQESGAEVIRNVQVGRDMWLRVLGGGTIKLLVHPVFENDKRMVYGCSRKWFNEFLETGRYSPEEDRFDLEPIIE